MGMKRRGRKSPEDGAAAVEMALILPLLFFLVFGIVEFGFAFNRWISVTHASREGVRQLSIGKTESEAETAAKATAPDLAGSLTCDGADPNTADTEVQMVCSAPISVRLFVFRIFNPPAQISSTAKMSKE
jgi:Flp pilus assembly protein TadG